MFVMRDVVRISLKYLLVKLWQWLVWLIVELSGLLSRSQCHHRSYPPPSAGGLQTWAAPRCLIPSSHICPGSTSTILNSFLLFLANLYWFILTHFTFLCQIIDKCCPWLTLNIVIHFHIVKTANKLEFVRLPSKFPHSTAKFGQFHWLMQSDAIRTFIMAFSCWCCS